ncbi:MAG: pyruvate formate lyase family protein [Candidatus Brocadiia bacterium]
MDGPFRSEPVPTVGLKSRAAASARALDRELAFTEAYRAASDDHVAIREARCLGLGRLLKPIREGDLFAGRHMKAVLDPDGLLVGFGLEHEDCGRVYYCEFDRLRAAIEELDDPDYRRRCEKMLEFWEREDTQTRYFEALPDDVRQATRNSLCSKGIRLAGVLMDYDKLIRLGLPGLRKDVREHHTAASAGDGREPELYEGMLMALDLLEETCLDYSGQARRLAATTDRIDWCPEAQRMAVDLEQLTSAPPRTMRQGLQLMWLYSMLAGATNFGRMDVYLGDLCAEDLDSGRLSEEEAVELLVAFWHLVADVKYHFNGRIIVGGRGRRNEPNADRFALLAMEASHRSNTTEPQLSLRFYEGQDPALMEKAMEVIGDGCVYPILYNDDVNVPAVQNAFGVGAEEAVHYLPYGCGEYALDHRSIGSPNTSLNLLKAVQVVMHNGVDPDTGKPTGLRTGDFTDFETFDDFWDAYAQQVEYHVEQVARAHAVEYEIERTTASFLYASMLYDDCLELGKSLVDGGARYRGAVLESMGLVNAGDCLAAIKKLVYDERRFTPEELLRMLEADWEGYERERQLFVNAPKYGNDNPEADDMVCRVSEQACRSCMEQAEKVDMDYVLLVCINNWAHMKIGEKTGATPDGRRAGTPIANGNGPTAGNDRNGVTAFLTSIAKPDPTIHAGYVHNMKFSKKLFRDDRPKLDALLKTYFRGGGTQAMITVVGRDDLEAAMREPENYANLMVRVGGFCARFVDLDPELQRDIINRTHYE